MKQEVLVSIVIPLYNSEIYISETIKSVIEQTYKNWELIIVDDCSTDNSRKIVREYEKKDIRIILIESEINFGGPAKPRNIGVSNSRGEYIAFLDSDDVWHEDKLKIQINYMIDNNLNFSSTNITNINDMSINIDSKSKILDFIRKNRDKATICDLIKHNFIATSSVIVDQKIISTFNESTDLISVEDLCLWLEILKDPNVKYKYLDEKLLKYRVLNNSVSDRGMIHKQRTKANICILTFILRYDYYKVINCFYKSIVRNMITDFFKKTIGRICN